MLEWLPSYNLKLFGYDFVAGLTIALLTIPHYAKLSEIPPSVGVRFMDSVLIVSSFVGIDLIISVWDLFMFFFVSDCSFIPPFMYAMFATSLMIAAAIEEKNVFPETDPKLS